MNLRKRAKRVAKELVNNKKSLTKKWKTSHVKSDNF